MGSTLTFKIFDKNLIKVLFFLPPPAKITLFFSLIFLIKLAIRFAVILTKVAAPSSNLRPRNCAMLKSVISSDFFYRDSCNDLKNLLALKYSPPLFQKFFLPYQILNLLNLF